MTKIKPPFILFIVLIFVWVTKHQLKAQAQDGDYFVYVSSAADDNGSGIIQLDFNSENGQLKVLREFKDFKNTSYLNLTNNGRFLYAIRRGEEGKGFLVGFAIDEQSGALTFLNEISDFGRGPCYVSVSNEDKRILVANYSGGNVCSFKRNRKGMIKKMIASVQHYGGSKATDRQNEPHPHMILPAPQGDIVLVPDLGMDRIKTYRLAGNGKLLPSGRGEVVTPAGGGPRHFAFHPNGRFGYVINEMAGSVTAFSYDPLTGNMTALQTLPSLPESFTGYNKSADIHLTPNGKFLYASNRGPNSIALFAVNADTGMLTSRGTFSCGGEWPRAFAVDPTGKFLLVANKNSNDIAVFNIDPESGQTELVHRVNDLGAPQCIKFLAKKK